MARESVAVLCFFASVVFLGLGLGLHFRNYPKFLPPISSSIDVYPTIDALPFVWNFTSTGLAPQNISWMRLKAATTFSNSFTVCADSPSASSTLHYGFSNEAPAELDSLSVPEGATECALFVNNICYGGSAGNFSLTPDALLWVGFVLDAAAAAGSVMNVRLTQNNDSATLEACHAQPFLVSTVVLGVFLALFALMWFIIFLIFMSICCWPRFEFWWYYFGQIPFLGAEDRATRHAQYQVELRKIAQMPAAQIIERDLANAKKSLGQEVKILLSGDSGKDTIAQQMKLLYLEGFSDKEVSIFTEIIHFNILRNMKTLVVYADRFGYQVAPENEVIAKQLKNMTISLHDFDLSPELAIGIGMLWKDDAIQSTMLRDSEFQLDDSASYFFNNLERIIASGYKPSTVDILYVPSKTIGIRETEFVHEGLHFRLIDAGGQFNTRRKWLHCFQDVTAIIYVVNVACYDKADEYNMETNRLREALRQFDDLVNNRWFANTSVILFLNNKDLFETKIQRTSLRVAFPQFEGPDQDYAAAMDYILKRFLTTDQSGKSREIYSHETQATDTENIRVVFGSVEDIFLTGHLDAMGY